MTIKAIETVFRGFRFRSRLEARWAVFFDALKMPFFYEPEGFSFEGHNYLPDFYLPTIETYIEIKPNKGDGDPTEEKHRAFGKYHRLVILWGEPGDYEGILCWHGWDNLYEWCECPCCGSVDIQFSGRSERIKTHYTATGIGVERAMLKARQARFEHEESSRRKSLRYEDGPFFFHDIPGAGRR